MAENKNSFLFYVDWNEVFSELKDNEAGKLIKHILSFVNDENPPEPTGNVKMAWIPIKLQLKRDLKKWEGTKTERSESGILGNLKRWHSDLYDKVIKNEISLESASFIANDRKAKKNIAKVAVTDTVNVTVIDNVTEDVKVTVTVPEVYFFKINGSLKKIKLSEFFKKNNQVFYEAWLMRNTPEAGNKVLEIMDQDYLGYDFTEENHILNTFKYIHKNLGKNNYGTKNGKNTNTTGFHFQPGGAGAF
jgi:hypothetical protein